MKKAIISVLSVFMVLGIATSAIAFAASKNGKADSRSNRIVSSERIEIAKHKYNAEKEKLHNKYANQIAYKYEEAVKSSDPYEQSAASLRAFIEAGDLTDQEITNHIIDIAKRAGYLPADYSLNLDDFYDNDTVENQKRYCYYISAICKTFNDGSFYMTTDEEDLLLVTLSSLYDGIKHGTMRGEHAESILKEIQDTLAG